MAVLIGVLCIGGSDAEQTSDQTGSCKWSLDGSVLTIKGSGETSDYDETGPWGNTVTEVIMEDGVTSIGKNLFSGCSSLKTVRMGAGIVSVGEGAFKGCNALESVYFSNMLETVAADAFDVKFNYNGSEIDPSSDNLKGCDFFGSNGILSKKTYTVTFRVDDKEIGTVTYTDRTEKVDEPNLPSIEGYDLSWPEYVLKGDTVVDADKALQYTVKFDANGGYGKIAPVSASELLSQSCYFEKPANKHFVGWALEPDGEVITFPLKVKNDITLYAIWEFDVYVLTYKVDGIIVDTVKVSYGQELDVQPKYVKKGYTVTDWNTDNVEVKDGKFTVGTSDITFFAASEPNVYKVIYKVDGNTVYEDSDTYGKVMDLRPKFEKRGYDVSDWKTDTEGIEVIYNQFTISDSDVVFEAESVAKKFFVIYRVDSKNVFFDEHSYGSEVTVREKYSKTGYTYTDWITDNVEVTDGKFVMSDFNVTFTAESTVNKYSVKYIVGGEVISDKTYSFGTVLDVEPKYTKPGYEVSNWVISGSTVDENGQFTIKDSDVVFSATLKIKKFSVTYLFDGELIEKSEHEYGETLKLLPKEVKKGHTVSDWETTDTEIKDGSFVVGDSDILFTSFSKINQYAVKYKVDGIVVDVHKLDYNTNAFVRDIFEKRGYAVSDWETSDVKVVDGRFVVEDFDIVFNATSTVNQYKVVYKVDGIETSSESYDFGATVDVAPIFQKKGYTVSEWSTDEVEIDMEQFTMIDSTVTLSATSAINSYEVVYRLDGKNISVERYDYGKVLEVLPKQEKTGYTFTDWTTEDTEVVDGKYAVTDHRITFVATSEPNKHKVVYKVDGEVVGEYTESYGSHIDVRAKYDKQGYNVSDWTTEDAEIINGQFVMGDSDICFSASSKLKDFTVTYMVDGNVVGTEYYNRGEVVTLREKYEKIGYTVSDWASDGVVVENGKFAIGTENILFEAFSTINQYKVVYKVNDDVIFEDSYTYGAEEKVRAPYEKAGYTVSDWITETAEVNDGKFIVGASDIVFVATMTANKYAYSVSYVDEKGNNVADPVSGTADFGTEFSPEVPLIKGYTAPDVKSITISYNESENAIVYTYSINSYRIVFIGYGGEQISDEIMVYGTKITVPTPSKESDEQYDYKFTGWSDVNGNAISISETACDNITAYAVFEKTVKTYKLIFYADGSEYETIDAEYGTKLSKPKIDPSKESGEREYYVFKGWEGYDANAEVRGNMEFSAVFIKYVHVTKSDGGIYEASGDESANLPSDKIAEIKSSEGSDKSLSVKMDEGNISFDWKAIESFKDADAALVLKCTDPNDLSKEITDLIGHNPLYSISFGDNVEFGDGKATITLPYILRSGESPDDLTIYYISEGKVVEKIPCSYSNGYVTFQTNHFSDYAIVCEKSEDSGISLILIIGAVITITAVIAAVLILRNKI